MEPLKTFVNLRNGKFCVFKEKSPWAYEAVWCVFCMLIWILCWVYIFFFDTFFLLIFSCFPFSSLLHDTHSLNWRSCFPESIRTFFFPFSTILSSLSSQLVSFFLFFLSFSVSLTLFTRLVFLFLSFRWIFF